MLLPQEFRNCPRVGSHWPGLDHRPIYEIVTEAGDQGADYTDWLMSSLELGGGRQLHVNRMD